MLMNKNNLKNVIPSIYGGIRSTDTCSGTLNCGGALLIINN